MFKPVYFYTTAAAALLLAACGGGDKEKQAAAQQQAPKAVPVTVETVKDTSAVYHVEYPATVTALNEIRITAQVSGYVTGIFFKDGDKVKKGQKLYSIDAQIYSANYQQAVANQQVQETNMDKAEKDAARYHELLNHDAIAKQQVDYADAALEAARKQVKAAKAQVASVAANVKFATITAPFNGTIGISQVKVGTAVVAGQTQLNTISTDDPMAVDFNVDQSEIFRFVQLQQKGTNPKDSLFTLAFGSEVYAYPGSINLIDRAVDPQTGTLKTRLSFPNPKGMLKAGMNATVRVVNSDARSIIIPYKAVTEQLGEFFVYVVGDSNKVAQQKVVLGQQLGDRIVVRSGLKTGDPIVVQGVQNLRQNAVITTGAPAAAQQAPQQQKK